MRALGVFIFTTVVACAAHAQVAIEWAVCLGGSSDDYANCIQQTTDGGYIVAGYSHSTDKQVTGNHGNNDYWVAKIDSNGALQWEQSYGGSDDDQASSVQQTRDGGYIVAGIDASTNGEVKNNHGRRDVWVLKLDSIGTIEWSSCYGGSDEEGETNIGEDVTISQTHSGGFSFTTTSASNDDDVSGNHTGDNGVPDYWTAWLDSNGTILRWHCVGGTANDISAKMQITMDDGVVIVGSTYSNDGDVTGYHGNSDVWIVKENFEGSIEWEKCLGGSEFDAGFDVKQTRDGGYIVLGTSSSNDGDHTSNTGGQTWIVKLDSAGNILWNRSPGRSTDQAYSIIQSSDGGYVTAGFSQFQARDTTGNHGANDYWIAKFDSLGNQQWEKFLGGSDNDNATCIQQTRDGNFIIAGTSASTDGQVVGNHGANDFWIVKLGPPKPKIKLTLTASGSLTCDTSKLDTILITNIGSAPLTVNGALITGADAQDFNFVSAFSSLVIPPDSTHRVLVLFTPHSFGTHTASVNFYSDDLQDSIATVFLSEQNDSVKLTVTPLTIDLGILCPNVSKDSSFEINCTVNDRALIAAAGVSVSSTSIPLIANISSSINFHFAGAPANEIINDSIIVVDSICGSTSIVHITGVVAKPVLTVNSLTIIAAFGTTVQSSMIISNSGNTAAIISALPDISPFTFVNVSLPITIPAHDSVALTVSFNVIDSLRHQVIAQFNAAPCGATASGSIVGEYVNGPVIHVIGGTFTSLPCDTNTIDTISITNFGTDTLIITTASIGGVDAQDFIFLPPLPTLVFPPGVTKFLIMRYTPHAIGISTASLTLRSNSKVDSLLVIQLKKRNGNVGIAASDTIINLGYLQVNTSRDTSVSITNVGAFDDSISVIAKEVLVGQNNFAIASSGTVLVPIHFNGRAKAGVIDDTIFFVDGLCGITRTVRILGRIGILPGEGNIVVKNSSANAGDVITIPIVITDTTNLYLSGTTSFSASLRFNATLLDPIAPTPRGTMLGDTLRIIPLVLPAIPIFGDTLMLLHFQTMLGNDSITMLTLDSLKPLNGALTAEAVPGKFQLLGLCKSGNEPLVNPNGLVLLSMPYPNPSTTSAQIYFSTIETGATSVKLMNALGMTVKNIFYDSPQVGTHTIQLNTTDLESGTYFVVLQTPTVRQSVRMNVMR